MNHQKSNIRHLNQFKIEILKIHPNKSRVCLTGDDRSDDDHRRNDHRQLDKPYLQIMIDHSADLPSFP